MVSFRNIGCRVIPAILFLTAFIYSNAVAAEVKTFVEKPLPGKVSKPIIAAASAVLMDSETGQVLFDKNGKKRLPNASTTKIMTAILIIENRDLDDYITASKKASETPFTSLHLKPGEKISVKDLLYGMMIRSANDASVAAAENIGGSVSKFANMMNKKAKEIGCNNTHFVTPNGLFDKNHYSCAYDLCLMSKYAIQYPIFNDAIKTQKYFLNTRTKNKEDLAVFSKSKFLKEYPGADGIKSGYICQARHCYVGSATRNNQRLISTVLKTEQAKEDTVNLMDYGFKGFYRKTLITKDSKIADAIVINGSKKSLPVTISKDLSLAIPKSGAVIKAIYEQNKIKAPVFKGDKVGNITVLINGKESIKLTAVAQDSVDLSFSKKSIIWLKYGGIIFACALVINYYGRKITKNTRRRRYWV